MARNIWFSLLKNSLFLAAGLLLLYLAFRDQDMSSLLEDLRGADYRFVVISVLIGVLAYISRGIRWLILLEPMGYKPRLFNSVITIIVGYFSNLAIPRIGELTRCTSMGKAENIPVDKLFGTVILERIIDILMLLTLTVITVLLKVELFGVFFVDLLQSNLESNPEIFQLGLAAALLGAGLLIAMILLRGHFRHFAIYSKTKTFLIGIKEGLASVRKIRRIKSFLFHTILIWICYYTMTWSVFFALDGTSHLGMIDGLFILVVGGFGMAAPVQGGIGAYHLIVSMGMAVLGIAKTQALSYATIVHTSQTIFMLFAGSTSLILLYIGNRKQKTKNLNLV